MAKIIAIETSNSVSSAALAVDGVCTAIREAAGNDNTHRLTLFIDEMLQSQNMSFDQDIDAVAVSAGPGSYTGLRIGVATAKGLCFASGKPLIAVGTIDAMCYAVRETYGQLVGQCSTLIGMVDARRMEVYAARYDTKGVRTTDIQAMIIDENSFTDLDHNETLLFGSGATKCSSALDMRAVDVPLSAKWLCGIADQKFLNAQTEDIAYFEPNYIKEFVALTSCKKLF